jgi:hypothetical protein
MSEDSNINIAIVKQAAYGLTILIPPENISKDEMNKVALSLYEACNHLEFKIADITVQKPIFFILPSHGWKVIHIDKEGATVI